MASLLYPKIRASRLPLMLRLSAMGALIAGGYGVLHGLVTFTVGEEYFTRMKFEQLRYLDIGQSRSALAGAVGFMASWWVGAMAGWFQCRSMKGTWTDGQTRRAVWIGYMILLTCGALGYGAFQCGLYVREFWEAYAGSMGVLDIQAFTRVAYFHLGSYAGAALGLCWAIIRVRRMDRQHSHAGGDLSGASDTQ